jgi:hypothetical protein
VVSSAPDEKGRAAGCIAHSPSEQLLAHLVKPASATFSAVEAAQRQSFRVAALPFLGTGTDLGVKTQADSMLSVCLRYWLPSVLLPHKG